MELGLLEYAEHITTEPTKSFHYRQIHSESFQNTQHVDQRILDQIPTKYQPYILIRTWFDFISLRWSTKTRNVHTIILHTFSCQDLSYVSETKVFVFLKKYLNLRE